LLAVLGLLLEFSDLLVSQLLVRIVVNDVSVVLHLLITFAVIDACEKRARQVSLGVFDHL